MKRPIILIVISYIIGILGGLYLQSVAFIFILILIMIFMYLIQKINNKYLRFIRKYFKSNTKVIILIFILLGYIYTLMLENSYNTLYLDEENIEEYCIVTEEKQEKKYKDLYKVKIINSKNKKRNGTFLYIQVNQKSKIEYGDMLFIKGKYTKPEIDRNEGQFNYKNYLKTLKIHGTINVQEYKLIQKEKINKILLYTNKLKNKLKNNVEKVIDSEKNKNLIIGMVIGDTQNLEEDIKEAFLNSNLYHILSVSGGQVSNIILGITFVLGTLKVHKRIMYFICILILLEFMIITGLTPSIVRACVMGIINLLSIIIFRRNDIFNSLGISLLIILANNPYSITSLSVLLSYLGFIGIITLGNCLINKTNKKIKNNIIKNIINILISTISAQIFILPITLYTFGTISLTFVFSNLLVIPLSTIITIMGFFVMLFPLQIFKIISPVIEITINIAKFFSEIDISKIYFIIPNILEILLYYFLLIYLYYMLKKQYLFKIRHFFRKYKIKIIYCIFLIIFGISIYSIFPKQFKLNFIDVGQGDSTLIVTNHNKKILIDGGGNELNTEFDIGEKTLLPYLLKKKIWQLDYVMISHMDFDHVRRNTYYNERIERKKRNNWKTI